MVGRFLPDKAHQFVVPMTKEPMFNIWNCGWHFSFRTKDGRTLSTSYSFFKIHASSSLPSSVCIQPRIVLELVHIYIIYIFNIYIYIYDDDEICGHEES
jgi:hypothetical protein